MDPHHKGCVFYRTELDYIEWDINLLQNIQCKNLRLGQLLEGRGRRSLNDVRCVFYKTFLLGSRYKDIYLSVCLQKNFQKFVDPQPKTTIFAQNFSRFQNVRAGSHVRVINDSYE